MGRVPSVVLKSVLALCLAGAVVVQVVILPLLWEDLRAEPVALRIAVVGLAALGVLCLEVFAVCVWRLQTLADRRAVFSGGTSGYVTASIVCFAVLAAVVAALAALMAAGDAAPGVVALVGGTALVLGGVALVIRLLARLLRQATEREIEARQLRRELSEVV